MRFVHSGANEGFRSWLLAYRDTGQGAVVMVNSGRDDIITEIFLGIAHVYGWEDYGPTEVTLFEYLYTVYVEPYLLQIGVVSVGVGLIVLIRIRRWHKRKRLRASER